MSLLAWDSFDYDDTAHLAAYYETVEAGASIVAGGRCSTNCLRTEGTPSFRGVEKGLSTSDSTIIFTAAIKRISGTNSGVLFQVMHGGTGGLQIYLSSNGSISGRASPSAPFAPVTFTTPGGLMASNAFHHLQMKILLSNTVGRVQIRVDGSLTDNYDSGAVLNTTDNGVTYTGVRIGGMGFTSGNLIYYDDLVIMDSLGTTCKDFLGDIRVEALEPTAAGNKQQWTLGAGSSNYSAVDDGATPDDDTTYITSSTVNQIDTNITEDSALPTSGIVHAVGMKLLAKKDQPGNRTIAPVTRISGTDYVNSDLTVNQDSYTYRPEAWEVSPATAVAWTITELNGAEFGVKLTN